MPIKVAIVEDDSALRKTLSTRLNRTAGFSCVGSFATAEEAIAGIVEAEPDIFLVDVYLPGVPGHKCVVELKSRRPSVQIMMLTVAEDYEHVFEAMVNGATGYLIKGAPMAKLLASITELYEGGSPMSAPIARMVVQAFAHPRVEPDSELTGREREILTLVARGCRHKEVAVELKISTRTVNAHLRQIYSKLRVRSKEQAIARLSSRSAGKPNRVTPPSTGA